MQEMEHTLSVIFPTRSICPVCKGRRTFWAPIEYRGNQYLDLLSSGEVVVLVSVKVMQMYIMMVMVSSCQRENQEEPDWHPEPNC